MPTISEAKKSLRALIERKSSYFDAETFKDPRRTLNIRSLVENDAIRLTEAGNGRGGVTRSNDPEDFALVTLLNDAAPGTPTLSWPDKPASIAVAQKIVNGKQKDGKLWLSDGKLRQILASADALGLPSSRVYV